jgi:hydrogenase/urease accessory protein HupE
MPRCKQLFTCALTAGVLLSPQIAQAHLVTTGLGPVYDGIGHLVLSFRDLIPALGMALLAGLRGVKTGRWSLFALPLAWFVGGLIGLGAAQEVVFPFEFASFMVMGILIATDAPLPASVISAIIALFGFTHGYANGTAIRDVGAFAGTLELLGIAVALFVITAIFAAIVVSLRWDWSRIVVRVAGSWIAAIGLLFLGWQIKTGALHG